MAAGLLVLAAGNYLDVAAESGHRPLAGGLAAVVVIAGLSMIFAPLNVAAFLYIPGNCAARPSDCSPCCATKAEASALRSPKPFWNAASNFTRCD